MGGVIGEKVGMARDGPELDPLRVQTQLRAWCKIIKNEVPTRSNPPKSGKIYPDPTRGSIRPEDNSVSTTIF